MHANVEKSADLSLRNLGEGIGYIDLLLLHCMRFSETH
jgi:aryl-alcohol dehydrogenase-like predicted oxidoreductase